MPDPNIPDFSDDGKAAHSPVAGPFKSDGAHIFKTPPGTSVALAYTVSDKYLSHADMVDLLNKGTHFDALMRVVYELLRYPEDKPPFDDAHAAFEAAIGREWDDEKDGRPPE